MNKAFLNNRVLRFQIFTVVLIFATTCFFSGCEPLRKKFVRKKKKDQKKELIPLLDPIDYPEKEDDPAVCYQHHYALWKVWAKDLIAVLQSRGYSDKRIRYLLGQLLVNMEEMEKLLKSPKKEGMIKYIKKLKNVVEEFETPAALRNDYTIRKRIELIDKQMRQKMKFKEVQESLVAQVVKEE